MMIVTQQRLVSGSVSLQVKLALLLDRSLLHPFGIAENVRKFVESSMNSWKMKLISSGKYLGTANSRREICQGDSPSPLFFVVCMIPLTLILRGVNAGYEFKGKNLKLIICFYGRFTAIW